MQKNYIAPLIYTNDKLLINDIEKYLQNTSNLASIHGAEWYLKNIRKAQLTQLINTGYMFYMTMNALPKLIDSNSDSQKRLTTQDIYHQYVHNYFQEAKNSLARIPERYAKILELSSAGDFEDLSDKLGEYMAAKLHLEQKMRLHEESELFQLIGYNNKVDFRHQRCSKLLSLIPAKIEVTRQKMTDCEVSERIAVGFKHDTQKNYYLVQAILKQVNNEGTKLPNLLAAYSIIKDVSLVRLLVINLRRNVHWQEQLLRAIYSTRFDKSSNAIIYAANAITLLVAANYVFSGEDLHGVSINGADLRGGLFEYTNFNNADLTGVDMTSCSMKGAQFISTIMTRVSLGIYPDLLGHSNRISSCSFSYDGNKVVSGAWDDTLKIWDAHSGEELHTLTGHFDGVISCGFSLDGTKVVSGSKDKTVKVWNVHSGQELCTIMGHSGGITSCSFSHDGTKVISASWDNTVKIWDVYSGEELRTLTGHSAWVSSTLR